MTKKNSPKKDNKDAKKMMQTHAKEERFEPTTLDQIWGDTGNTRYGTMKEEDYLYKLQEMNKSDLQTHANTMGIVPVDDREILTKKLLQEFKKYVSGFKKPSQSQINNIPNVSKEVAKILAEGK